MNETRTNINRAVGLHGKASDHARLYLYRFLPGSVGMAVFFVFWEIAAGSGWIDPGIFPTPSAILSEMLKLTMTGELVQNSFVSLVRVVSGLGLALAVALPLGFILGGWFRTFELVANPLLRLLSYANPFTLFPVFIVLFGLGELSKIMIIFSVCLWPIMFGIISGIKNTDPSLLKASRSLGLNPTQVFWRVSLPSASSSLFAGLRVAVLIGFLTMIGAEMIGASSGLGHMILTSCPLHTASFQLEKMWAGIVTVALLGMSLNAVLQWIEKRSSRWREDIEA